jgi:hypothetical protein
MFGFGLEVPVPGLEGPGGAGAGPAVRQAHTANSDTRRSTCDRVLIWISFRRNRSRILSAAAPLQGARAQNLLPSRKGDRPGRDL